MTEAEWDACTDRLLMLQYLRGKVSERKLRLFAAACCRRIWSLLADPRSRRLVEVLERRADRQASDDEFEAAVLNNRQLVYDLRTAGRADQPIHLAASAAGMAAGDDAWAAAWKVVAEARRAVAAEVAECEARAQALLLRDIIGNPFRPVTFTPAWRTPAAVTMAQAIYDWRAFDRLPGLANVLEAVGCADADMLAHCRYGGEHARGCWVVDLVLARE
jgi:hypothetical protein